jgi:hypothetical protein
VDETVTMNKRKARRIIMKNCRSFIFTAVTVFFGLLFAVCDNGSNPDTTPKPDTWSVIKNVADIAGVWEGASQIELLGDGVILPSSGLIDFKATFMNERLESRVDMVLKIDFSSYLDGIIALNPDSGYTKDSLWAEYKKNLSGSGYNAGNYFIIGSDYTYTSSMTETDDFLINTGKNKIKMLMTKYDFALMGMAVASDVTLILNKIAVRPAALIIKGGDEIGGGEYIIAVKINSTTEDTQMEGLGIGQYNENFVNDGNDVPFSYASTNLGRGRSQTFMVPGGKYAVKISIYRGSFLGWRHYKSQSFTIENGGIGTLTYDGTAFVLKLTNP